MPQDEEGRDFGPHNGHLGTSWEIAVIVVFVVLLVAVVSTLIFHVRRKQRRKRQEQYDLERGRREQAEKELNTSAGDRNSRRQSSFANNSAASLPRVRTLISWYDSADNATPTARTCCPEIKSLKSSIMSSFTKTAATLLLGSALRYHIPCTLSRLTFWSTFSQCVLLPQRLFNRLKLAPFRHESIAVFSAYPARCPAFSRAQGGIARRVFRTSVP